VCWTGWQGIRNDNLGASHLNGTSRLTLKARGGRIDKIQFR